MVKKLTILFAFCFMVAGISPYATAASNELFKTPMSKQSDQWRVDIKRVQNYDSKMAKPLKDVNEMYNITITNIGEELENVVFNSYRDQPNTQTKYGLSISDVHHNKFKQGEILDFANFPISVNSKEFEIEISWHRKSTSDEAPDRKYKQTFSFTSVEQ